MIKCTCGDKKCNAKLFLDPEDQSIVMVDFQNQHRVMYVSKEVFDALKTAEVVQKFQEIDGVGRNDD